jgi:RNA polymerase sigma factor (sigma-70 family)
VRTGSRRSRNDPAYPTDTVPAAQTTIRGMITLGDRYEAVLGAARRGEDAAWAEIYRDLSGPVIGYLRAQRAPDADDLLGETMLQMVRDLQRFEGDEAGFRSWVFTIAHRRLLDARRSSNRKPVDAHETTLLEAALPPVDGAEPEALAELELDDVLAVLDRITDDQREVLLLRLVGDLDIAQTAAATGRTIDAVKALSKRGLDRLRVLLGQRTSEDPPSPTQTAGRSHG